MNPGLLAQVANSTVRVVVEHDHRHGLDWLVAVAPIVVGVGALVISAIALKSEGKRHAKAVAGRTSE